MTIEEGAELPSERIVGMGTSAGLSPGYTLSAGDLTASTTAGDMTIWVVSDNDLQQVMADYTTGDVKAVLDEIIADKSVGRKVRRQAVSRVVANQPHPTKEFKKYDRKNDEVRASNWGGIWNMFSTFPLMLTPTFAIFALVYGTFPGDYQDIVEAIVRAMLSLLSISLVAGTISYFLYKLKVHKVVYGDHANLILDEAKKNERERCEEKSEAHQKVIEQKKKQLAALTAELSGESLAASLTQAKQDFSDAKARIASYETDLTKALKYPAFNDITVPAVNRMVRQMRTCQRMLEAAYSEYSAAEITAAVDDLWVDIQTAEKDADNIAWSTMTDEERELLRNAQQLLMQAQDSGNTETMRENMYARLKVVVDRLNSARKVVPAKVMAELESNAAPQIEPKSMEKTLSAS